MKIITHLDVPWDGPCVCAYCLAVLPHAHKAIRVPDRPVALATCLTHIGIVADKVAKL